MCPGAMLPKTAVAETPACFSSDPQKLLALPERTLCHARCDISNDAVVRKVEYHCMCNAGNRQNGAFLSYSPDIFAEIWYCSSLKAMGGKNVRMRWFSVS